MASRRCLDITFVDNKIVDTVQREDIMRLSKEKEEK